MPRELSEGALMVANRLRKNLRKFKIWRERDGITCFRVYDADLPEYAAAIDVYKEEGGEARTFLHVQEYAAPEEIPEADVRRRRNELLAAAREVFALPARAGRDEDRASAARAAASTEGSSSAASCCRCAKAARCCRSTCSITWTPACSWTIVRCAGTWRRESRGKRFLNLFGYTGVASVQAAVAGADSTTSVDLSATYLEWCAANLALNGFAGAQHRLVQADALRWLEAEKNRYDVIFCDPPTFSNSARADDFDIQREHVRLLRACVDRLTTEGVLYFSNNFRRFKLDEEAVAEFAQLRGHHRADHSAGFRAESADPSLLAVEESVGKPFAGCLSARPEAVMRSLCGWQVRQPSTLASLTAHPLPLKPRRTLKVPRNAGQPSRSPCFASCSSSSLALVLRRRFLCGRLVFAHQHRRRDAEHAAAGAAEVGRVGKTGLLRRLRPRAAAHAAGHCVAHARPQQVGAKGDARLGHEKMAEAARRQVRQCSRLREAHFCTGMVADPLQYLGDARVDRYISKWRSGQMLDHALGGGDQRRI